MRLQNLLLSFFKTFCALLLRLAQNHTAIYGQDFKLKRKALAVLMWPARPYFLPESFIVTPRDVPGDIGRSLSCVCSILVFSLCHDCSPLFDGFFMHFLKTVRIRPVVIPNTGWSVCVIWRGPGIDKRARMVRNFA